MRTKKIVLPFLFLIMTTIFIGAASAQSTQTLKMTLTTNTPQWNPTTFDKYDLITLSGTVAYGSATTGYSNPANALVGIEVDLPSSGGGGQLVLRTVQTGTGTVSGLPEQITSAYPVNGIGGSQTGTVENDQLAYFAITVNDQDSQTNNDMLLAVTIFDGNGVPVGIQTSTLSQSPGSPETSTLVVQIPSTAHQGPAYGYADLYSALPSSGGVPMAQEFAFQFTISGGTPYTGPAPSTASATAGAYSLTFRIPKDCPNGAYQAYASCCYPNQDTTGTVAQTGFNVILVGDFNFAGSVSGNDLFIFAAAYIDYYSGGQDYNTNCDINGEGGVTSSDFFLFVSAYIQYWSP